MAITLISTVTLGSSALSIDFTSIPQTYTDLMLVLNGRTDRSGFTYSDILIKLNGANTNFSHRALYGTGSSASSWNSTAGYVGACPALGATSSTFGNQTTYIPNYTSSNYKSISSDSVAENNATATQQTIDATLWSNTAAITSISIYPDASTVNFVAGSTATLYGVTKGTSGGVTVA